MTEKNKYRMLFRPLQNDMVVDFYINDSSDNDLSNNYDLAKLWCSENTQDISDELLECKRCT